MKEYDFYSLGKGGKAIIKIDNNNIIISRPGLMSKMAMGFKGDKIIPIKNITSVQIKLAGFARGYIQFSIAGEISKKVGVINGELDENIVYFDGGGKNSKANKYATEIKEYIDNFNNSSYSLNIHKDDKYDKLAKLKKLLDDKVITQEEFDNEKKKILN